MLPLLLIFNRQGLFPLHSSRSSLRSPAASSAPLLSGHISSYRRMFVVVVVEVDLVGVVLGLADVVWLVQLRMGHQDVKFLDKLLRLFATCQCTGRGRREGPEGWDGTPAGLQPVGED